MFTLAYTNYTIEREIDTEICKRTETPKSGIGGCSRHATVESFGCCIRNIHNLSKITAMTQILTFQTVAEQNAYALYRDAFE